MYARFFFFFSLYVVIFDLQSLIRAKSTPNTRSAEGVADQGTEERFLAAAVEGGGEGATFKLLQSSRCEQRNSGNEARTQMAARRGGVIHL